MTRINSGPLNHFLVEAFGGTQLSGVGFGMGELALLELLKIHNLIADKLESQPQLYLAPIKNETIPAIISLATRLRTSFSLICNPFSWKVKRHFEAADLAGSKLILLIGPQDLEKGVISVRIVESGEQKEFLLNDQLESELSTLLYFD